MSVFPSTYIKLFGLRGNPFTSEIILEPSTAAELFVHQACDVPVDPLITETVTGEGCSFINIVGPPGSGRTMRLRYLQDKISRYGGLPIYISVNVATGPEIITTVVNRVLVMARSMKTKIFKALNIPVTQVYQKRFQIGKSTPSEVGDLILSNLKGSRPCALLIDDVYNIYFVDRYWTFYFYEMIRQVVSSMPEGIIVALTFSPESYKEVESQFPALISRVHEKIVIPPLSDQEALSLIIKRLAIYRTRKSPSKTYPFTEGCIFECNKYVDGVPQNLLKLLGKLLDMAAVSGVKQVDTRLLKDYLREKEWYSKIIEKVGAEYKSLLRFLFEKYPDRPFELDKIAMQLEIPVPQAYTYIEELIAKGIINRSSGNRYILSVKSDRIKFGR